MKYEKKGYDKDKEVGEWCVLDLVGFSLPWFY